MKSLWYIVLISALLTCPVLAVDTSNWVNITSNIGISFKMPPNWAWDPIDPTSLGVRNDKSDTFLMISYIPVIPPTTEVTGADFVNKIKKDLSNLSVPNADEVTYDNKSITVSGTTLDGTIINYTESYEKNHSCHWVSEYSDKNAVTMYADTIRTIIGSTIFN